MLKHMGSAKFIWEVGPFIACGHALARSDYLVVAVMREPLSWVHSWYRSRDALGGPKAPNGGICCGHVSFSEFVRAYYSADPPRYARIGNQLNMFWIQANGSGLTASFV
jgi:hypothetical protein